MKIYLILLSTFLFVFTSCNCHCEGDTPVISAQNQKLVIFKKDTLIDFVRNQTDTIHVNVSAGAQDSQNHSRASCTDPFNLFSKKCDCPSDYTITSGYNQWSIDDSISFSLSISTEKSGSYIRYMFNQRDFYEFDSTNISKTINNKLYTGLSLKEFSNSNDSISRIYYKDSLGLVSVIYKNGKTIDIK